MVAIFTGAGAGFERGSGSVLGSLGLLGSSTLGRSGEQLFFNAATGNFLVSQRDEFVSGIGLDASIGRTYNSLGDLSDDNGDNWRHGYDKRIANYTAGVSVQRVSGDGSVITYNWDAAKAAFVATDGAGAYDTLTLSGGTWTWTDGDSQVKETYSEYPAASGKWRLATQADADGNTISFSYTGDKLTQVTTAGGWPSASTLTFTWSGNNLTSVTTSYTDLGTFASKTLTRTSYSYDGQNRLSTVTVDLTPENATDSSTYVTTYSYLNSTSKLISRIAQSDGSQIDITYTTDGTNRVASLSQTASTGVTRTSSISYGAGYTAITDPLGQVTRLDFDGSNRLTKITIPSDNKVFNPQFSGTDGWIVTYNPNGIATTAAYSTSVNGKMEIRTDFNAASAGQVVGLGTDTPRLASVTAGEQLFVQAGIETTGVPANAQLVVHFYDGAGNYLSASVIGTLYGAQAFNTKISGLVTVPAGAAKARLEVYAHTTGAGVGSIALIEPVMTNANAGMVARFGYNSNGDVEWVDDALGQRTSYAGFANGNWTMRTDRVGNVTNRIYGSRNELLTETTRKSDMTQFDAPHTARFVYDSENHLRYQVSAEGLVTEYRYFAEGYLGQVIEYPEHSYNVGGLAQSDVLTEAQLDAWVAAIPDRSSAKNFQTLYDLRGNVRQTTSIGANSTGGPSSVDSGRTDTFFTYDQAGNLRSRFVQARNTETFVYDGLNRLTASVDVNGATTTYVFNDAATTTTVTFATGLRQVSVYNKAGELLSFTEQAVTATTLGEAAGTANHAYDKNGRLRWTQDATNRRTYFVYDPAGRKVADISSQGDVVEYRYDANDRLIATIAHGIAYAGSLAALDDVNALIDPAAYLPAANAGDLWSWHIYDREGRLIQSIAGDGSTSIMAYDGRGQLLWTTSYYNRLSSSQLAAFKTNPPTTAIAPPAHASDRFARNFYDRDGRLYGTLDGEGCLTQIVYDKAGQRIQQKAFANATSGDRVNGSFNALLASIVLDATRDRIVNYTYDGQGKLRFVTDGAGFVTRTDYDRDGQPNAVVRYANALPAGTTDFTIDNMKALVAAAGFASADDRWAWTVYDSAGRVAQTIDGYGFTTINSYDSAGRLIKAVSYANNIATATVDSFKANSPTSVTNPFPLDDPNNRLTRFYYDGIGALRYTVDAEGFVSRTDLDAEGRVIKTSQWANRMTVGDSTTTDVLHGLIGTSGGAVSETLTAYDALGRIDTVTNALGIVTRNEYGANGLVWRRTAAWGTTSAAVTTFYYDGAGRAVATRDAADYVTETSYTGFGQILNATRRYNKATGAAEIGVLPVVTPDAKDAMTAFEYDRRGLATKTTDAEGYYEQYTLNAFGDRVSVRTKLGATIVNSFDKRGLLTSETLPVTAYRADGSVQASSVINKFEYNAFGNRTKMIEAFGLTEQRTTNFAYDRLGRLQAKSFDAVTVVSYNDFTSTTAVTVNTSTVIPSESYAYDAFGNLKQFTDTLGGRTVSFYDRLGRKTAQISPLGTMTEWTYDSAGNMLTARVYGDAVAVPSATGPKPAPINAGNYRETVFTYDALNRLKTKSIANVLTSGWNGSTGAVTSTQTLLTRYDYDAHGNLVATIDPNLGQLTSYYDKLGRKVAEIDLDRYMTTWSFDAEGNVLTERRLATRVSGSVGTTTIPKVGTHPDDRLTTFTYDRNGNRLTETRSNVAIATVDTLTGGITETTENAVITYSYNGLGQVLTKQEATGDTITYTYDSTGRLIKESRSSYTDHASASVTPTVEYLYNGVNNLSRTRQGGATAATGDRITTYAYSANGRLAAVTDAAGGAHNYDYDAVGNIVRDSYSRVRSDGTVVNEGIVYRRDLLGRVISQAIATKLSETSWTRGDISDTEYNAYGEVSRRGINGMWQESFFYNNRGLVEKSNSGDGVWRFYVYDNIGNQSLAIEDENYTAQNLATKTVYDVLGYLGATAGATFVDGLNVTISNYDKRSKLLSTILTQRELATGATPVTIISSQTYNAFGEVKTQTDARGYLTDFTYNTMGRLIKKQLPLVNFTDEAGAVAQARPTELYYYDKSGRLVASRDPKGNLLSRTLLAGSGYGGTEALVTAEYHADGGIARNFYDKFGDARILRNELNIDENRAYDGMGRLITQVQRGGLLTDNYTYDLLGQRITHWNSHYGSANKERTDYDLQGRIVSQVAFGGEVTTTAFAWASVTSGVGATGGFTSTTTFSNGRTMVETTDIFGRQISKTDLGGHVFNFTYDKAGRQLTRSTTGETLTTTWLNIGLASRNSLGAADYSTYSYDAGGNRLSEYTVRANVVIQNATATYDELGRLATWAEAGGTVAPRATKNIGYDLNGNIKAVTGVKRTMNDFGVIATTDTAYADSFSYDSMNRVVGDGGRAITYNVAGQRMTVSTRTWQRSGTFNGNLEFYWLVTKEEYTYYTTGNLWQVKYAETKEPNPLPAGTVVGSYTYDNMGRVTRQIDYMYGSNQVAYDRAITYHATKNQISSEDISNRKYGLTTNDVYRDVITYNYGTGTGYALGSVVSFTTKSYKNGSDSNANDTSQTNSYAWYDGAVLSSTSFKPNVSGSTTYVSTYNLSASGVVNSVTISDGRPRTVTFKNDLDGKAIRRDEADSKSEGDPHEVWMRFNGIEMAFVGNNGQMSATDYNNSIPTRWGVGSTGAFRNGFTTGSPVADMDESYEGLNSFKQGSAAGRYTVQGGETLAGIAQSVWGDSSLWYKLAEANGLSADSMLTEGQQLNLPAGVLRNKNNASTFKPYDSAEALGNTSPTTRKPPKKNKCGGFGMVLLAAVAVAVTMIVTAGATAALSGQAFGSVLGAMTGGAAVSGVSTAAWVAGGAIGGAIGSAASQGVGIATGLQDEFSWKQVGLAAIAGGIGGGVNAIGNAAGLAANAGRQLGSFQKFMTSGGVLNAGLRGAASNALGQGVGVVTGLQSKFDWVGVAAAGAGAAAGSWMGGQVAGRGFGKFGDRLAVNMADSIAGAAARSLLSGTGFGDSLTAALPNALGQTIGSSIQDFLGVGMHSEATETAEAGTADPAQVGTSDVVPIAGPPMLMALQGELSLSSLLAATGLATESVTPTPGFVEDMEAFLAALPYEVEPARMLPISEWGPGPANGNATVTQEEDGSLVITGKRINRTPPISSEPSLRLTQTDVLNLKKTLETEWVKSAGSSQAKGIVDTILNRVASGRWGSTVSSVVNARNQFSDINGPISRNQHGRDSVEEFPARQISKKTSDFVDAYLASRASGTPSSIGTHLNYANPHFSDKKNLKWIMKLDGPVLGKGNAIHRHGTVPELQRFRPSPFSIQLPEYRTGR